MVVGRASGRTYDTLHGRHPIDRLRFTSHALRGKRAITHVDVVEHFSGLATLVRCRLATGRTHQIRVHLCERSHTPILGDPLYGHAPRDPRLRQLAEALGHQALHAHVLGFAHPVTGREMRWQRPPPADMEQACQALRKLALTKS